MDNRYCESKLKVGIDARFITCQPRRGIGNYSLNLVTELVKLDPAVEYILYIAKPDAEGILPNLPNVVIRQLWPQNYPLWENIALPFAAIKDRIDVLHCLGNTAPIVLASRVYLVITLHDVMFLQRGEFVPNQLTWYQKWGRLYRALTVPFVAKVAQKLLTVSEFSRKDILALIPGIESKKVRVTYQSCNAIFNTAAEIQKGDNLEEILSKPYFFCLGAEDPRKNTLRMVRAYLELLKTSNTPVNLVISGYANWQNSSAYRAVQAAGAEGRVKFLGFISISDLALLYKHARVFVYPSLFEGFGIPILEAFSAGCPVIASNLTSIPEVGGDAGLYFDPLNENEIVQSLMRLLTDARLRDKMIEAGRIRAQQFTWMETARKTLAVYRECMDENK